MLGALLYEKATQLEACLYGFSRKRLTLGPVSWYYLDNNNINKPKLVLLHGFSATHAVWLRCAKYLSKKYHIVIPDLPGHGLSSYAPDMNYSVPNQTVRLHQFLQHLGFTNASIAGNSMGGFMAARFALDHPNFIKSIICVAPAGVFGPNPSLLEQKAKSERNPFFMDKPEEFTEFYRMTMAKPPFMPKLILDAFAQDYVESKSRLMHIFSDFYNPDDFLNTQLCRIKLPCLLLWGAKDALIDISCAPIWQEETGGINVIWDELGHMPMLESPKLVAQEMERFLP